MPFDEKFIEVFKSRFPAGNIGVRADGLLTLILSGLCDGVHLIRQLRQKLLVDFPVSTEIQDLPKSNSSCRNKGGHYSSRNHFRKDNSHCG